MALYCQPTWLLCHMVEKYDKNVEIEEFEWKCEKHSHDFCQK